MINFLIFLISKFKIKKGGLIMADIYAILIIKGIRTFKSVPKCIKEKVKKVLIELDLEELTKEDTIQ